jgi:hypothetical protein
VFDALVARWLADQARAVESVLATRKNASADPLCQLDDPLGAAEVAER